MNMKGSTSRYSPLVIYVAGVMGLAAAMGEWFSEHKAGWIAGLLSAPSHILMVLGAVLVADSLFGKRSASNDRP